MSVRPSWFILLIKLSLSSACSDVLLNSWSDFFCLFHLLYFSTTEFLLGSLFSSSFYLFIVNFVKYCSHIFL